MKRYAPLLVAVVLALVALVIDLRHLGHARLITYDESFHAIVARHLLDHPLHPTLYERPALPYNPMDWGHAQTWLHKGTLPLWMIALSYKLLGVGTFALRLPSALLTTLCVLLTYQIGARLCDRATGLVAAAFQTLLPAMPFLTQGYMFSDHVDVLLLALVEAGVLFLVRAVRNGTWPDVVVAGVCQGLAYLTKSYLAAILTALAIVAWLLPLLLRDARSSFPWKLRGWHVLVMLAATFATALPWTWYCYVHFRTPFQLENSLILHHLNANVERWGAPWEQVIFAYLPELCFALLGPSFVALAVVSVRAARRGEANLLFLVAWALGVLVPHLVARSKTPSATLIGQPALLLLLAYVVVRAVRRETWALATWAGAVVVAVVVRPEFVWHNYGDPKPANFLAYVDSARWVPLDVVAGLALAAAAAVALRLAAGGGQSSWLSRTALLLAIIATADLLRQNARVCWGVARHPDRDARNFAEIARFAETLPAEAVLLVDEPPDEEGAHLQLMFLTDRASYSLDDVADALGPHEPGGGELWRRAAQRGDLAAQLVARAPRSLIGRPVYLVSPEHLPLSALYTSAADANTVYRVTAAPEMNTAKSDCPRGLTGRFAVSEANDRVVHRRGGG